MNLAPDLPMACDLEPSRIARFAEGRLRASPYLAMRKVLCECRQQTLYLKGRLPSYYLKQLAQEAVAGLDGVTQLVNEIEVVPRPESRRTAREIQGAL